MESKCSADKRVDLPPVPIKTYQWEDLRRAREAGAYPWTHLLKPELEGEITADDIIRETTPKRSMSREVSRERTRSRTRSPDNEMKILNLDSSPGSSRKIGEDGSVEGINIPNFSKEVSLDSEDDPINDAVNRYVDERPKHSSEQMLAAPIASTTDAPRNISPKSILKRRVPVQPVTQISETRDNTKCCHPLVNKIKHIADKTLHKHDKSEKKSPNIKRKKQNDDQPIVQLKSSPGAVRRKKFGAIKLGDSDEMSRTLPVDTSPRTRKKKEHIYEDIEKIDIVEHEKNIQFSPENLDAMVRPLEEEPCNIAEENEFISDKKSNTSQDPSLNIGEEEDENMRPEDHVMESLHKQGDIEKEALVLDADSEEPDIEEVLQDQLEEFFGPQDSPNITITEITDEDMDSENPIPLPSQLDPEDALEKRENEKPIDTAEATADWSKSNSDHEYEIIGKPPPNIVFTIPSVEEKPIKTEDELSSTTSLERKYLQHTSDDEEIIEDKTTFPELNGHEAAEAMQKDIEDRYFVSTPSTVSRTECDVSTSQVDSSALENLPLKRDSRISADASDSKLQQRFKEQKDKLKNQAGKLKTKLQNIKTKQFSLPERSKFKMPQMPERPKFSMPDRRKFSLPERPKFKKINISEKLSMGDRKKFTFPNRPKFTMPTMPDLPKFKLPDKARINFSSLRRKKEYRIDPESAGSSEDIKNIATVEFESRTYPRIFNRKKKESEPLATSSPTLNRADTPPPAFSFAKVSRDKTAKRHFDLEDAEEPREYGNLPRSSFHDDDIQRNVPYDTEYDFDKLEREYDEENRRFHEAVKGKIANDENTSSLPDVSTSKPECTHVINEINNDEFFVRPKGISRENIEVRQYLSDEIREAFKMPNNSLALMGSSVDSDNQAILEDEDADPELYLDDEPEKSITEDLIDKDDGYYTFPPVRPSRAKKMKKVLESVDYIDQSINASMQFSDVDIEGNNDLANINEYDRPGTYIHDDNLENFEGNFTPLESQTLPMPPKRKKKSLKSDVSMTSLNDLRRPTASYTKLWTDHHDNTDDIIVYRTEHAYVPESTTAATEHSPLPPRRRNRSRSSHATSLGDDDRTSHGAESLALDPNLSTAEHGTEFYRTERQQSPGYATVDKYPPTKVRRSKSKTPPARRRKSHSSERKYYTVDRVSSENALPNRPPRKKSSTSLVTLESFKRGISSGDITQYAEIDEPDSDDAHKDLKSGEIVSKMKDRPLPPPPRPPRGPKKSKSNHEENHVAGSTKYSADSSTFTKPASYDIQDGGNLGEEVIEIEVSTQTDPLPDDMDYEIGLDEHMDISMSSSLRDIGEEDIPLNKSQAQLTDSPRSSRPASRSDKSLVPTDPKIQELSKCNLGRTSPTVILVERRVSSPTRINEREEIVTEASLTVQPIDIDESMVPEVPPLPRADILRPPKPSSKPLTCGVVEERALEKVGDVENVITDVQLDNLVTQRLQVRDLDVGRLNVSELQASKILVSEIEGMTLQVTELDSKSGHISVSGIELSPSVIDEIVKKFAELATMSGIPTQSSTGNEFPRPVSREEETQTDEQTASTAPPESAEKVQNNQCGEEAASPATSAEATIPPLPMTQSYAETASPPPSRPPPPDLTPLLYSYLQDMSIPPASFYQLRAPRERPFSEFYESQTTSQAPPPPTRRTRRKPAHHSGSSSDEDTRKPSPRRMPSSTRAHEPTITEAGAQFFRVCQNSVSRTLRSLFNSLMSYVSGSEDKKDVQMALVIFLVLIAGLIMFGLSDGRTVHHHHWEFFNPPDGSTSK